MRGAYRSQIRILNGLLVGTPPHPPRCARHLPPEVGRLCRSPGKLAAPPLRRSPIADCLVPIASTYPIYIRLNSYGPNLKSTPSGVPDGVLRLWGCLISCCTDRAASSGARNAPWRSSRCARTGLRRAPGTRGSGGCSGLRSSGSRGSRPSDPWSRG